MNSQKLSCLNPRPIPRRYLCNFWSRWAPISVGTGAIIKLRRRSTTPTCLPFLLVQPPKPERVPRGNTRRGCWRIWTQSGVTNALTRDLAQAKGLSGVFTTRSARRIRSRQKGRVIGTEQAVVEENVEDKRLLVIEAEFVRALQVAQRDGSILSAVIREAWDSGNLGIMTRAKKVRATDAHIAILGHITREELVRHLSTTEACNGYANRFLWVHTQRSKKLPFGGNLKEDALEFIRQKLASLTRTDTEACAAKSSAAEG